MARKEPDGLGQMGDSVLGIGRPRGRRGINHVEGDSSELQAKILPSARIRRFAGKLPRGDGRSGRHATSRESGIGPIDVRAGAAWKRSLRRT